MATIRTIELNDRFRHALMLMEYSDRSLFITGRAGTGKSTLLSHFCARTGKKPVTIAPTGVAALNVGGQTIHKFFHFPIDVSVEKIRRRKVKPRNPKLFKKLRTVIIDEISMVRADILDCIDEYLRLHGPDENKAFGGVQMIFVGDLYQLPPIVNRDTEDSFAENYETPYFFSARCLKDADFSVIELDLIYRQKDQTFVELLNRIRTDDADAADLAHLNTRFDPLYQPDGSSFFINLTTTNRKADEINTWHLNNLPGRLQTTRAVIEGDFGKEYYPTAPELQFKAGAQVMLINNDTVGRWVNGSIGVIEAIKRDADDRAYAEVRLEGGHALVHVYPHKWEVNRFTVDGGDINAVLQGTFTQFPFRLAWAVTIHKSQGKTFDHVMIDIDRGTFAAGQMYVALSRCTTFEGIVLRTRIAPHHIRTDGRIVEFLERYAYEPPAESLAADDPILQEAIALPERVASPLEKARETIRQLVEGVDPITQEKLPADAPYHHPEIIGALVAILEASGGKLMPLAKKPSRNAPREDAPNNGKKWNDEERVRAAESFKQDIALKQIALEHGRTYGSIRAELIRQGLIESDAPADSEALSA